MCVCVYFCRYLYLWLVFTQTMNKWLSCEKNLTFDFDELHASIVLTHTQWQTEKERERDDHTNIYTDPPSRCSMEYFLYIFQFKSLFISLHNSHITHTHTYMYNKPFCIGICYWIHWKIEHNYILKLYTSVHLAGRIFLWFAGNFAVSKFTIYAFIVFFISSTRSLLNFICEAFVFISNFFSQCVYVRVRVWYIPDEMDDEGKMCTHQNSRIFFIENIYEKNPTKPWRYFKTVLNKTAWFVCIFSPFLFFCVPNASSLFKYSEFHSASLF